MLDGDDLNILVKTVASGAVEANTHVIIDCESGDAAVVDSGECTPELIGILSDERIKKLRYILLTHGHFDHIGGVPEIKRRYPDADVVIHEKDEKCLSDDLLSLARGFGLPPQEKTKADIILKGGERLAFGGGEIEAIHTPGHTKGGVTYRLGNRLFTGDTLFYLSIGRTDFPGGSYEEINDSIIRLFSLGGDYTVYAGHGQNTTLDFERKNNSFVRWDKR